MADITGRVTGNDQDDSNDQSRVQTSKPSTKSGSSTRDAAVQAGLRFAQESADRSYAVADEAVSRSANKMDDRPKYIDVPSYRRGGRVRRGGVARLHKGERRMRRGGRR